MKNNREWTAFINWKSSWFLERPDCHPIPIINGAESRISSVNNSTAKGLGRHLSPYNE